MKRFIAIASLGLSLACVVALANASDSSAPSSGETTQNQPGSAVDQGTSSMPSGQSATNSAQQAQSQTQAQMEKQWKSAKSCTDSNGVTYRHGTSGFKTCVDAKIKAQQGGTAGQTKDDSQNSAVQGQSQDKGMQGSDSGKSADQGQAAQGQTPDSASKGEQSNAGSSDSSQPSNPSAGG